MNWINQSRKAIAALLVGALGWATQVVSSERASISAEEWIALATVVVTVITVYFLANEPAPDA